MTLLPAYSWGDIYTYGSDSVGASSCTPAWPVHVADDLGFLVVNVHYSDTIAVTGDWTHIVTAACDAATATQKHKLAVYWKRATSAAMSTPTVTRSVGTGDYVIGRIVTVVGGAVDRDPIHTSTSDVITTASTAVTFPAVTTTKPNCLILFFLGSGDDSAGLSTSGYTNGSLYMPFGAEFFETGTTTGGGGGFTVGRGKFTGTGSTGTTTATTSNTAQSRIVIAVLPPQTDSVCAAVTAEGAILQTATVTVDVTGPHAGLYATFANHTPELIHDGANYLGLYTDSTARSSITGGYRYAVSRRTGWPSNPTIDRVRLREG